MQLYRLISLAGILGAALFLSACNASTPSQVLTGKIRVKEQIATEMLDAGTPDPARVRAMAKDVLRNGKGAVTLTVPYLAGDIYGSEKAESQGAVYKRAFAAQGVTNVSVAPVPVADRRHTGKIVMSYLTTAAVPAKGCTRIPGYQGAENMEGMEKYQLGCEMQSVTSRMVADPSDLLGKGGAQDNDSRRSGTIIEPYKSGTPNEPIGGMQASKVGSGG